MLFRWPYAEREREKTKYINELPNAKYIGRSFLLSAISDVISHLIYVGKHVMSGYRLVWVHMFAHSCISTDSTVYERDGGVTFWIHGLPNLIDIQRTKELNEHW